MSRRPVLTSALASVIVGVGCSLAAATPALAQTFGGIVPSSSVRVSPATAGAPSAHDFLLNLGKDEPEPASLQVDCPLGFVFNAFEAVGGIDGKVGSSRLTNLVDEFRFERTSDIRPHEPALLVHPTGRRAAPPPGSPGGGAATLPDVDLCRGEQGAELLGALRKRPDVSLRARQHQCSFEGSDQRDGEGVRLGHTEPGEHR